MSRLLVVLPRPGAGLDGVVADSCELHDGVRVFLRDGAEVLRAAAGVPVVVRDLPARRLEMPEAV